MLVPTMLIDVSWHTHQLAAGNYQADVLKYVGYFLNHNDKVEEGVLGKYLSSRVEKYEPGLILDTH